MNKTLLIARSEYLRRVLTKGFLVGVLLAPLGLVLLFVLPAVLGSLSSDDAERRVAILDESGRLYEAVAAAAPERFAVERTAAPLDSLRVRVLDERLDVALVLPASLLEGRGEASVYGRSGGGLTQLDDVRDAVRGAVRDVRLADVGAPDEVQAVLAERPRVRSVTVTEDGDAADGALLATIIGFVVGFAIYLLMFIYGQLVMRGVIEEKQNRIVEVIASSVRPFELLMGKVLGIGAVGLTQVVAWGVLGAGVLAVLGPVLALFAGGPAPPPGAGVAGGVAAGGAAELPFDVGAIGALLTPGFLTVLVLCFLGGYLFYAALFAAVGSAVEQESDAQSLMLPLTLPIIVPILFLQPMLDQPDSTLSVVLSILPPFSTILLPVRAIATDVPVWQTALALALLAVAFLGAIWVAARVYRVGILMYGKKATFGDLWRWVRTA
ncbi:ABC transporter permease [Rubrivirga sp. S365]|uniref:ABC transporter permease n=1 Tax=Rubrivirga litoralis TaxID=3075598 RepID=A0ABU3BUR7_9BACT|nr:MULTISPECIES: ABC transporter permease [unclassified Rubrivirga]MDT0633039.1 ABC transporter permease [Rubrivirga sp. F394]MDT7856207.1 ABC transporter permease [Rubrivirga sp. S365]